MDRCKEGLEGETELEAVGLGEGAQKFGKDCTEAMGRA